MTTDGGERFLGAPRFDVVLRGYDRRQVDEHLARLQRVIARLRADLEVARSQQPLAAPTTPGRGFRAPTTPGRGFRQQPEPQPWAAPPRPPAPAPDVVGGFTDRMQSILRAAEEEAAEIRRKAHAEAAGDERLRAQVAELASQRDAVVAELDQMRARVDGRSPAEPDAESARAGTTAAQTAAAQTAAEVDVAGVPAPPAGPAHPPGTGAPLAPRPVAERQVPVPQPAQRPAGEPHVPVPQPAQRPTAEAPVPVPTQHAAQQAPSPRPRPSPAPRRTGVQPVAGGPAGQPLPGAALPSPGPGAPLERAPAAATRSAAEPEPGRAPTGSLRPAGDTTDDDAGLLFRPRPAPSDPDGEGGDVERTVAVPSVRPAPAPETTREPAAEAGGEDAAEKTVQVGAVTSSTARDADGPGDPADADSDAGADSDPAAEDPAAEAAAAEDARSAEPTVITNAVRPAEPEPDAESAAANGHQGSNGVSRPTSAFRSS
ncbi:MAG: hypothetical protein ACT4RN_07285 [Pseudonocardia sp.]